MQVKFRRYFVQKFIFTLLSFSCVSGVLNAQGIGGMLSTTENVFWLRSDKGATIDDNSNLTTWSDEANSHHATNNTEATNPFFDASASVGTNAEPAILFTSASSEHLDLVDDANINTGPITARSIFFTFQTGADITTQQYLYQQGDAVEGIFAYISTNVLTIGINSSSTSYSISTAALAANTAYFASFIYDGGAATLDLSLNGTSSIQVTSVATSIATHTSIRVGSDSNNANFMNGHIAELIYYNVVLNEAENRVIENALSEKYGITTANDHYVTAGADYRYNINGIGRVSGVEHNLSTGLGGTLYLSESANDLINDEHVYVGHNNSNLSTSSIDMGAVTNSERYNRVWYLQKTGASGLVLAFDIVEAGLYTSVSGLTATDFSLLTRAGTSGDFGEVTTGTAATFNGDRVQFTLTDAEYTSGYFTLASPSSAKKWYVINSGNWSDTNTWTLDPAGLIYNNPDALTPDTSPTSALDEVTILSSKTVTVENGDMSGTLNRLIVDGTLDFASSIGHGTVTTLEGSGIIRQSDDILPTITDASNFITEGTVEYYGGTDINLTPSSGLTEFYNLTLSFDDVSDNLIISTDITINGVLNINSGDFQINDATDGSANVRTITAKGDVTIAATGAISTGTGDPMSDLTASGGYSVPVNQNNYYTAFHQFEMQGNFTNNGTAKFHNLDFPSFRTLPTQNQTTVNSLETGVTTVKFTGYSNNNATLNGETSFYNLLIDKGADNTYSLTINASSNTNFYLFGKNNYQTTGVSDPNPDNSGKALWIKNGVLELTGSVKIASLVEAQRNDATTISGSGSNSNKQYFIPQNGKLFINGSDVEVYLIARSGAEVDALWGLSGSSDNEIGVHNQTGSARFRSLILSGYLQMDDGLFEFNDAEPLQYMAATSPVIEINGGTLNLPQIRSHSSATGDPSYIQTGGAVNIIGDASNVNSATINGNGASSSAFAFPSEDASFIMSGGSITIQDLATGGSTARGLYVNSKEGNYNVTGGNIIIDIGNGETNGTTNIFDVIFTPNFYNLTITDSDDDPIQFLSDVVVSNDLTIEGANASTFDLMGNDLTVGRNFIVESGATYTQGGDNTTSFNGDAEQTITIDGTRTDKFYDVIFDGIGVKTIQQNIPIENSMTIESGATINDGGNRYVVNNILSNSGTHISETGGDVVFGGNGNMAPDYVLTGDGTGIFGNLTLNDGDDNVEVFSDFTLTGDFSFTNNNTYLLLGTHKVTLSGADAGIAGSPGSLRYIRTAGNDSDGGLSMYIGGNGTYSFPIGTNANSSNRYTPVSVTVTDFVDDGYITINPVDNTLETLDQSITDDQLTYYWKSLNSDFDTAPTVSYAFTFVDDPDDVPAADAPETDYVPGWVLNTTRTIDPVNSSAGDGVTATSVTTTSHTIIDARYTAATPAKYSGTITTYYAIRNGEWHDPYTWSTTEDGTSDGSSLPEAGDIVQIGDSDENFHVSICDGDGEGCASPFYAAINVAQVSILRNGGGESSILSLDESAGDHDLGIITNRAPGETTESASASKFAVAGPTLPSGDFGEFNTAPNTIFAYNNRFPGNVNTNRNIPVYDGDAAGGADISHNSVGSYTIGNSITEYSNMQFESTSGATADNQFVTLPDIDITINGQLRFWVSSGYESYVKFNPSGTTVEVMGDVRLNLTTSVLEFPATGSASTLIVHGDLNIENTNSFFQVEDAAGSLEHKIQLYGDMTNSSGSSAYDFYIDDTRSGVILEFIGEENSTYSSSTTSDFYQILMNKGDDDTYQAEMQSDFTLPAPAVDFQPIVLENGTLVINNTNIGDANDILLTNETNDIDFNISSTAALQISQGTVSLEGDDLGITLNGALILDNTGILDMDGGTNNYIEYTSSGTASIDISGTAQLLVGSQIRKDEIIVAGILNYSQSGGTVLIGQDATTVPTATNRSMFEVSGVGSSFTFTGGDFIISNHLTGASIATLYLDPASSNIGTGTTVQFGDASTALGFEDMTIQTEVNLYDLALDNTSANDPSLTLLNTSLILDNDLTIDANTTFDASGLGLNIGGDLTNNGTFTSNSNTTTFDGSGTQIITGNGTNFYDLNKSTSSIVQLASGSDITITNDLTISAGTFNDNDNDITIMGDVTNHGIHTNTSGTETNSGLIFNGASGQNIYGEGTFSRIEIDNSNDVTINDNITVTEQIGLNTGSLDIQGFLLSLSEDAVFVDAGSGGFSSSKMVQTRSSFTDAGVIKTYNGTTASPFTYPIGSGDKYTPVVITLTQNSETTATITVRAADEIHPNVQEDVDVPEFVDADNALQYFWEVTSSGMTDFLGNITYTYIGSDAYVTSPFTLEDYTTARLLPDDSDNWNKLETGFNFAADGGGVNSLSFDIVSAAADSEISGDYTAGVDEAIPDQVQTVTSNVNPAGNWTDGGSWDTGTAPRGAIVEILADDIITMDDNGLLAYRSVINGTLIIDGTTNQRLGIVSGTGTIIVTGGTLPAGVYDDFFNCTDGGTLAFDDTDSYTLPDAIATVRNLLLRGSGTKSFPNTDITICNDLTIEEGVSLNNSFNRDVLIQGNLSLTNGLLDLGSDASYVVNGNVTMDAGSIDIGNNSLTILGDLTINGGTLALGADGTLDLTGDLILDGGTISGANASSMNLEGDLTYTSGTLTIDATTTSVTMDGTSSQSIAGDFTGSAAFNNLIIDKASGSVTIIDGGNDVEVEGVLTLTSGNLISDATNTLTITSTGSISGGNSGSYVQGPLTKIEIAAAANFTFPIGNSTRFGYARLEGVVTGSQDWTAEYFASNANNGATIDETTNAGFGVMTEVSNLGSWDIVPSGANTATVELGIITGMGVGGLDDVRVAVYDGPTASQWVNLGGSPSGDQNDGSVTSQATNDFAAGVSNVFALGGINAVALPVDLILFTTRLEDGQAIVNWSTASEINNDFFEIQRSGLSDHFETIGVIEGNGTTNWISNYEFVDDQPFVGTSYYRLMQIDYDGMFEYYGPVVLDTPIDQLKLRVGPNPIIDSHTTLSVNGLKANQPANVQIVSLQGVSLYQDIFKANDSGSIQKSLDLSFRPGIYLLMINAGESKIIERLIVR